MGHGPNPALTDPSHNNRADQAPLQLGVMASGSGSNFEAVALAIQAGDLNARIQRLVVNNPGCGAQQRAERLGIPVSVLDHRLIKNRRELDSELVRLFRADQVELVVMAGWMRIVTEVLVSGYSDRLINIHPSLLPSFRGLDAIGQALEAGVKVTGCTVHIVTEELDAGPILARPLFLFSMGMTTPGSPNGFRSRNTCSCPGHWLRSSPPGVRDRTTAGAAPSPEQSPPSG